LFGKKDEGPKYVPPRLPSEADFARLEKEREEKEKVREIEKQREKELQAERDKELREAKKREEESLMALPVESASTPSRRDVRVCPFRVACSLSIFSFCRLISL